MTIAVPGERDLPTVDETRALGVELAGLLRAGDVVVLDGPLGAGKTALTTGIAAGLGVRGRVTSPTFVIAREHPSRVGGPTLVHVDAYRLLDHSDDPLGELDSLDLDTEIEDAVVVAEWGGGFMERLSDAYLAITINLDSDDDVRVFTWKWVN